jgi:PKD repeat protein
MNGKRLLPLFAALAILVSACTQQNTGDEPAASTAPQGLNRFLLFPNPVAMNSGGFETNTTSYADAYYRAIDPANLKDTIDKWKTQNGFGGGTGTEKLAVFRDAKDLGYGRRMTGRQNTDGSIAFFVENYNVTPTAGSSYSSVLNVEAAIKRDTQWHVGTNAIEWSSTPCGAGDPADCSGTVKFAKYYNFSSRDGTRQLAVDLDGNGLKAMPGPCITCHGGRGDPLTPDEGNPAKPRFPLVENSVSRKRGDVQARLHGMNVDSFDYSPDIAGFSKSDQQATLKQFNQWILCTYPLAGAAAGAEDACRVAAGANEWQGTAAEMIKSWYGGPGMPNGTFSDTYVPTGWQASASVYTGAVAPFCRTCHILRGTKNQDDIDFMTSAKFLSYADRIKAHVFDRGTMPLALIVYDDFWGTNAPNQIANFINPALAGLTPPRTATDSGGVALKPGRPIASPGPNRMVRTGANATLTAEDSLFAGSFNWSMVSGSATIADPSAMITTFNASAAGDYVVKLTVSNGTQSDSRNVTITVNDSFPDPQTIGFARVKNTLQNITYNTAQVAGKKCVTCHVSPATSPTPPVFYNNFDRNGTGVGGVGDATDDTWFLKAVQGRVNLTEIEASQLLRKPSGNHHNGLMVLDVADKTDGGGLANYSILYNWILAGMQGGGVAADATISSAVGQTGPGSFSFTFAGPVGGPFVSPNINLDGSTSLGATSYAWTVFGPPGPLGTPPAITNPTSAIATLNVFNVGTYVVQLQVSDGVSTDTVQRTIVVSENPITASFTPATGTSQVTFSGSSGPITLTSTSTGSPTTCFWQVSGPAGATLDGFAILSTTKSCGTPATLIVPVSSIGGQYTVQLTASNIASSTADNFIVVAAAPGQNASNANFNPPATTVSFTVNGNSANAVQARVNGGAATSTPGISLSGTANGLAPLTFTWSLPSGGGSAGCSTPSAGQNTTLFFTRAGTCSVTLTVSNNLPGTSTVTNTVTITSTVTFSNVIAILGNAGSPGSGTNGFCTGCHVSPGTATQPSWETDGSAGQNSALLTRITTTAGVINATPKLSRFLVCPNVGCNTMGGPQTGFANNGNMQNYDAFLTWITNGLP